MRRGVAAGNDLLMICHRVELAMEGRAVLEALPAKELGDSLARVAAFKTKLAPPTPFSEQAFHEVDSEIYALRVATLGEELAAIPSPEDGKRSPVEMY